MDLATASGVLRLLADPTRVRLLALLERDELTVAELVEITNTDPRRGIGHEKILTRITVDAQTIEVLAKQGLALDDMPEFATCPL